MIEVLRFKAMEKRTLILLTATVNPMVPVSRADPETRLIDYMNALSLWWEEFKSEPVDILFVENSGYNLKLLHNWIDSVNAGGRIRIFQFAAKKDLVSNLGKGAGEAEMFDECFNKNYILNYEYVLKSTGRLFISNAKKLLINTLQTNSDWSISFRRSFDLVDTRFFIIRSALFGTYLLGLANEVNDSKGIYIEHVVFRRVCRAIAEGRKWGKFSCLPKYEGVSGSDGIRYNSLSGKIKYYIFNLIHRVNVKYGYYRYF